MPNGLRPAHCQNHVVARVVPDQRQEQRNYPSRDADPQSFNPTQARKVCSAIGEQPEPEHHRNESNKQAKQDHEQHAVSLIVGDQLAKGLGHGRPGVRNQGSGGGVRGCGSAMDYRFPDL